jgi:hypothetical protein
MRSSFAAQPASAARAASTPMKDARISSGSPSV